MTKSALEAINSSYGDIVWYRKRWFIVVTILIFPPATLLICLTGDIYAKRKDGVFKFSKAQRYSVAAVAALLLAQGIIRAMS